MQKKSLHHSLHSNNKNVRFSSIFYSFLSSHVSSLLLLQNWSWYNKLPIFIQTLRNFETIFFLLLIFLKRLNTNRFALIRFSKDRKFRYRVIALLGEQVRRIVSARKFASKQQSESGEIRERAKTINSRGRGDGGSSGEIKGIPGRGIAGGGKVLFRPICPSICPS